MTKIATSDIDFKDSLPGRGNAFAGVAMGIGAALLVAFFATGLPAADRPGKHRPAEIWYGSKLVVSRPETSESSADDPVDAPVDAPDPNATPPLESPRQPWFALEPLTPALPDISPLRATPTDQPISATHDGGLVEPNAAQLGNQDSQSAWAPQGVMALETPVAAVPRISVDPDSDYEIHGPHETTESASEKTAVQPLSFHFTIEEKGTNHPSATPDRSRAGDEFAIAPQPSQQESSGVAGQPANSSAASTSGGSGRLLPLVTFVLGLLSFPLILGVCASVYLRRTVTHGPLFRIEIMNPAGGEQPSRVGLARVSLSAPRDAQPPDAAESFPQHEPSAPAHRHGKVIDEPLPIAPIGPTYDEQKRQEEKQRQEVEQAMLEQAFQQNLELHQRLAMDSDE